MAALPVAWLGLSNPRATRFVKHYEMGIGILPVVALMIYFYALTLPIKTKTGG